MELGGLLEALKQTYCGPIDAEYMHITGAEEKRWIRQRIESGRVTFDSKEKKHFLSELAAAEGLKCYLGARLLGAKRFSLEGGNVLIPMLREMVHHADNSDTHEVVLEMVHRGRLNVLMNVLGKKPQDLSDEFTDKHKEHLGTGDVKYHVGFSFGFQIDGGLVHPTLAFNPSHLEIVSPVVIGSVRTRPDRFSELSSNKVLLTTIHGDTAITGQGVVQEILNMSKTHGYEVDGTTRIAINNQVGLTTSNPPDACSMPYCTDIGKIVQTPIFHVNANDPEVVAFMARLTLDFRNTFKRDVFIDLVCHHRRGHNGADEPSATQLLMYRKIRKHPTSHKIYADKLEQKKVATLGDTTEMVNLYRDALDAGDCVVAEQRPMNTHSFTWLPYPNYEWDEECSDKVKMKRLQELTKRISTVPEAVEIQSRVAKTYGNHQAMAADEKLLDWGGAENLAYTALVDEDIPVRLSGEDSGRDTFFRRHAVIHDQSNDSTYTPLQHIHNGQDAFRVQNSALSREAVLTFEYGYVTVEPRTLTIWEAQSGGLADGAQVAIDQFIFFGEQKWSRMRGLVVLLPHGYEGQGPEYSSARLECRLQLCAEQSMQVCIPSTPTQVYRMLHHQALHGMCRPPVVMSPRSLLRRPLAVSGLEELVNGTFLPVIGEIDELDPKGVKRVVMCSGKVYYDLLEQRRKNNQHDVTIMRTEQLYPFPHKAMQEVLQQFAHVEDFVWYQEEPLSQGAWHRSRHRFREAVPFGVSLRYIGRPTSASPAVGYMSVHQKQQQDLINNVLNVG